MNENDIHSYFLSLLDCDLVGRHAVKVAKCARLDECHKIKVILDKDLLDFQYAEAIRCVCERCSQALVSLP